MKFKAGDLAIIIKTHPTMSSYLGRIVELIEYDPRDGWLLSIKTPLNQRVRAHEWSLFPINGDGVEEKTSEPLKLNKIVLTQNEGV